jgi:hypothetical protein
MRYRRIWNDYTYQSVTGARSLRGSNCLGRTVGTLAFQTLGDRSKEIPTLRRGFFILFDFFFDF